MSGEIAGESGVMGAASFGRGGWHAGLVLGTGAGGSFKGLGGEAGRTTGSGSSVSGLDSALTLDFPPRATGGGMSSSFTAFPFFADVSMDCNVCE